MTFFQVKNYADEFIAAIHARYRLPTEEDETVSPYQRKLNRIP